MENNPKTSIPNSLENIMRLYVIGHFKKMIMARENITKSYVFL